jgi:transcriptional regulator with XRE-family HTH domain
MSGDQRPTFGDLLCRARQAAGLTQVELAERAQLSVRGINDLERGARQTPRKDTVALLAAALGLTDGGGTDFEAAARRAGTAGKDTSLAASHGGETTVPTPPTGTVTLLSTDIESSTCLLQELGITRYAVLEGGWHAGHSPPILTMAQTTTANVAQVYPRMRPIIAKMRCDVAASAGC